MSKTPDIIYRLDTEGNVTYISNAIRNFGYHPDDMIGKPFTAFFHPDDNRLAGHGLLERRTGKRGTQELEVRFMISDSATKGSGAGWVDAKWSTFLISSDGLYADDVVSPETYRGHPRDSPATSPGHGRLKPASLSWPRWWNRQPKTL